LYSYTGNAWCTGHAEAINSIRIIPRRIHL